MNPEITFNENEPNSSVKSLEGNASVESQGARSDADKIADAAFASLDKSTRSSLESSRDAFERAEIQLAAANAKRDETWSVLPEDLQKSLANATRKNPTGTTSAFLNLKPSDVSMQTFDDAVCARRRQLQVRKSLYQYRAECSSRLIDRFLSTCSGASTLSAPFPVDEFKPKADILRDLRFCESSQEAVRIAKERWKFERPCAAANRLRTYAVDETKKEKRSRIRNVRREMKHEFANSAEWKSYARSFSTIGKALVASAVCVVLLWLAILKWNLVYLLRYESIFPYKSDAYRFLFCVTPVVWLALALFYRNVVIFRMKFHSIFEAFKKDEAEAADALK